MHIFCISILLFMLSGCQTMNSTYDYGSATLEIVRKSMKHFK